MQSLCESLNLQRNVVHEVGSITFWRRNENETDDDRNETEGNAARLITQVQQQLNIIGARQRQCIENVMQSNQNLNERLQSALEIVPYGL